MTNNYYIERNMKTTERLKYLRADLPYFCSEFFVGIESQTTPLTRLNYAFDLRIFFDFLIKEVPEFQGKNFKQISLMDLDNLTATHLEIYLDYLSFYKFNGKQYHNNERAKSRKLSTVRSFLAYFFKKEKIAKNVSTKVDLPKLHEKEIVRLETNEVVDLLNLAESGSELSPTQQAFHQHTKVRDFALLSLLLGTGIRVSECVGLNLNDIDFGINGFRIIRKGGNQVVLYFSEEVADALRPYYEQRREQTQKLPNEPALFLSLQNKRITTRAVQNLVKKYAGAITPLKKISPHKLRSTYGTNLYRETGDIYVVADVLGHKDVNTTKKHYAAISDDIRRSAANKVKLRKD
ncbi:MAG: tyrosine-type recombinase/integrase [Firmicutes bacterium]|nr:tyrosine-type recombinase/integrase [Bacillota bacterium]